MFELANACRVCMNGAGNPQFNGTKNQLKHQLKKIYNIDVKSTDNHPKLLCPNCYKTLQWLESHLDTVKSTQERIEKLAAIELETTTTVTGTIAIPVPEIKAEPNDADTQPSPGTSTENDVDDKSLAPNIESDSETTSTLSHISLECLENLVEPKDIDKSQKRSNRTSSRNTRAKSSDKENKKENHVNKSHNAQSTSQNPDVNNDRSINDNNREALRRSRSRTRSAIDDQFEELPNRKRKRTKSTTLKETPVDSKRIRTSPPKNEISSVPVVPSSNGPETPKTPKNRAGRPVKKTASTPLKTKNDQSITKFFKSKNRCDICNIETRNPAESKFHAQFHSTRQCPGCGIEYADGHQINVTKHISCLLLEDKLTKEQLMRMSKMSVQLVRMTKEEIEQATQENGQKKPKRKSNRKHDRRSSRQHERQPNGSAITDQSETENQSHGIDNGLTKDTSSDKKKIKSKSSTNNQNSLDDSIDGAEVDDNSISLNWIGEQAKDKAFLVRDFESNKPNYIQIRKQLLNGTEEFLKLLDTVRTIEGYRKKATKEPPNSNQNNITSNAMNNSSPIAPNNNTVNPLNGVPPRIIPINARYKPSSVDANANRSPNIIINHPQVTPASIANRRRSIAVDATRNTINVNYQAQAHANGLMYARRKSMCIDRPTPETIASNYDKLRQINASFESNTINTVPNTNAVSLRSTITVEHSYSHGLQPNANNATMQQLQSQPQQSNYPQQAATSNTDPRKILPKVLTISQQMGGGAIIIPVHQRGGPPPPYMTSIARNAFGPNSTVPVINNPSPQPPRNPIKVLTVDALNARAAVQPNVQAANANTLENRNQNQIPNNPNGLPPTQVKYCRIKHTPTRPQIPETNNQTVSDPDAISVSLSRIHDDQLELTLHIRGERIKYAHLNDRQRHDVQNCLLRDEIWLKMLSHIKEGKPTDETLELFHNILPEKEKEKFFEEYSKRS